jgi:methionyl-tRNA synthetase
VEGNKMSKTLGNVIRQADFVNEIARQMCDAPVRPGQEAVSPGRAQSVSRDALRFYVLRHGPAKSDADFRRNQFFGTYNNELAGELGNLLSRVLGMLAKYYDGVIPTAGAAVSGTDQLQNVAAGLNAQLHANFDAFDYFEAIESVWGLVRAANKYIDDTQPFKLAKDPNRAAELQTVMHALCQTLGVLGRVLMPVLPESAPHMLYQLGLVDEPGLAAKSELFKGGFEPCTIWLANLPGTQTRKGQVIFPRLEVTEAPQN